jgi:hypothetical protein
MTSASCTACGAPRHPLSVLCPACGATGPASGQADLRPSADRWSSAADGTVRMAEELGFDSRSVVSGPTFSVGRDGRGHLAFSIDAVLGSRAVEANSDYREVAASVRRYFDEDDREYNAFASHYPTRLMSGETIGTPAIVVKGGYVFWSQVCGAVLGGGMAQRGEIGQIRAAAARLAERLRSEASLVASVRELWDQWEEGITDDPGASAPFASFMRSNPEAESLVKRIDVARRALADESESRLTIGTARPIASSICQGMLRSVIAHELGHVCLRHTRRDAPLPGEVRRIQERQADGFAASVLMLGPEDPYQFIGAALSWVLMAWYCRSDAEHSTHPRASERLVNLLRDSPSTLAAAEQACGMGAEEWAGLLPAEVRA